MEQQLSYRFPFGNMAFAEWEAMSADVYSSYANGNM